MKVNSIAIVIGASQGMINAAIIAFAKTFAEQSIKDSASPHFYGA